MTSKYSCSAGPIASSGRGLGGPMASRRPGGGEAGAASLWGGCSGGVTSSVRFNTCPWQSVNQTANCSMQVSYGQ